MCKKYYLHCLDGEHNKMLYFFSLMVKEQHKSKKELNY